MPTNNVRIRGGRGGSSRLNKVRYVPRSFLKSRCRRRRIRIAREEIAVESRSSGPWRGVPRRSAEHCRYAIATATATAAPRRCTLHKRRSALHATRYALLTTTPARRVLAPTHLLVTDDFWHHTTFKIITSDS